MGKKRGNILPILAVGVGLYLLTRKKRTQGPVDPVPQIPPVQMLPPSLPQIQRPPRIRAVYNL